MPRINTDYDWPSVVQTLRSESYMWFTQEELAHELRVCVSSVSKWETGKVVPQSQYRKKIRDLAIRAKFPPEQWPRKNFRRPRLIS